MLHDHLPVDELHRVKLIIAQLDAVGAQLGRLYSERKALKRAQPDRQAELLELSTRSLAQTIDAVDEVAKLLKS